MLIQLLPALAASRWKIPLAHWNHGRAVVKLFNPTFIFTGWLLHSQCIVFIRKTLIFIINCFRWAVYGPNHLTPPSQSESVGCQLFIDWPRQFSLKERREWLVVDGGEEWSCLAAPMKMTEDLESVMGGIRMGVNVDIKRTDGRNSYLYTHLAYTIYVHLRHYTTCSVLQFDLNQFLM